MKKRFLALFLGFVILLSMAACSIEGSSSKEETPATTVKETRIYNNYKDVLPDFDFENPISEDYEESVKYSFNVKCSEKECEKYIKKLKNAGFTEKAIETDSYYTAYTEDGYFVEMTYINGNLTVYSKKMA